jgi:hypothetical protein
MAGAGRAPPPIAGGGANDRAAMIRKASEAAVNRPLPTMLPPAGVAPANSGLSDEARRLAEREARLQAQEAAIAAQEAELAAERARLAQLRKAQHRLTMTVAASLMDDEANAEYQEAAAHEVAAAAAPQQARPLPPGAPGGNRPIGVVTCECEYVAEEERELSMSVGDELLIICKNEATGWFLAQKKFNASAMGWVPSTLISEMRPL